MSDRLVMSGIAKSFGATRALECVDLAVGAGASLALIGENGAGKSTLMKILTGAIRPDGGRMVLDGQPFAPHGPLDARNHGVAIVHQELAIAAELTVAENVLLGALPTRGGFTDLKKQRALAFAALDQLGCGELVDVRRAGDLPIAQQQLVEIARAIAAGPRLLVLDEPTSSLTAEDVQRLFTALRRLKAGGVSLIYISHFLEECRAIADRFAVIRDGRTISTGAMADVTETQIITAMVGREMADIYPRTPHTIGEPLLEVRGLQGRHKPRAADLTLRKGEVLGLFGLVGAGRSETLRTLFGLDQVTGGAVDLRGRPALRSTPRRRLAAGMGLLSENRKEEGLLLGRSIADNLTLTKLSPYVRAGLISGRRQRAAASGWMEKLGVKARDPAQAIGELSGGNQQKVAIARLLHHGTDLLLLDEPTRGIDVGAKAHVYRLIGELAASGAAIVVASSYLPELIGVCDTIAVMCRGRLGTARTVGEWGATPAEASHKILAAAIGQEE